MAKGKGSQSFDELVREALNDFAENGYDDQSRLDYWRQRLEQAMRDALMPESEMDRILREALSDSYRREVENESILRRHPGVSRFTLQKVKPHLRAELNKRIHASASLIKLDREKMIAETLGRFEGWATSIPSGGSDNVNKRKEMEKVKQGMSGIGFRERRVLIDQTHKLSSSISDVIAKGGGAIAVKWRSHYHEANYNYREEHKEREIESNKLPYLIRDSWAHEQGLVKLAGSKYFDTMTQPGEEVFCRCYAVYIYAIGRLPPEQLTAKGRARLAEARKKMAA